MCLFACLLAIALDNFIPLLYPRKTWQYRHPMQCMLLVLNRFHVSIVYMISSCELNAKFTCSLTKPQLSMKIQYLFDGFSSENNIHSPNNHIESHTNNRLLFFFLFPISLFFFFFYSSLLICGDHSYFLFG